MNLITLTGNVVREITTHTSENGTIVLQNSIAVSKETKDKGTDFFDFTIFGKQAEFLEKYADKGSKVLIVGKLTTSDYIRKDGSKAKNYYIIADKVEILSKFKEAETETETEPSEQPKEDVAPNEDLPF